MQTYVVNYVIKWQSRHFIITIWAKYLIEQDVLITEHVQFSSEVSPAVPTGTYKYHYTVICYALFNYESFA